ncbi:MAG TPA: hypothetical protein DEF00_00650 [Candidatus Taylorbacteria bacterium]|nr:MAG: hypothetical protein UY03_C0011G0012 [Parcubacteria group bacterium GW2011_GWA2_47_64]KKU96989.1 MAG: hypothetical protein UY29_C0004G0043 [Parcubacteria group bacterium GW2011_GWC2_48_17]HBV00889.1 hypothetical protein [Candidatus Taylorbacteria bacterium]
MSVVFEEDKTYPSAPLGNAASGQGGFLARFLLRTGLVKTESGVNTLSIILVVIFLIAAVAVYFVFGRASESHAVPEDIINTPQPTYSL